MIYSHIPILDSLEKKEALQFTSYEINSSIFKAVPTATFKYKTPYATPDITNFFIGSEFRILYNFGRESEDQEEDPEDFRFANLCVSTVRMKGSAQGLQAEVFCKGEFEFYQNNAIRKCYKNKYANEIIKDVFESNEKINATDYDLSSIMKTDNATTIYRSAGESDLDFIRKSVAPNFTIHTGKPIFFTGLDSKIHFCSINSLFKNGEKSKAVLTLSGVNDADSKKFVEDKIKNFVDDAEAVCRLSSTDYTFDVGAQDSYKDIKNMVYFSRFDAGVVATTGYSFSPANSDEKTSFPIAKGFLAGLDATRSLAAFNRPPENFIYESKNYFDFFENLICIKAKIVDLSSINQLLVAGDKICVITPYPYSTFNGEYLISEISYGAESSAPYMEVTLIRPHLDFSWVENLSDLKDSENFQFKFAPQPNKSIFYTV